MNPSQSDEATGQEIYEYKRVSGETWKEVGEHFGMTLAGARGRARRYQLKQGLESPGGPANQYNNGDMIIVGGMDTEPFEPSEETWARALSIEGRQAQRREWRNSRRVIFEEGPVALIAVADLHLGGRGVSYSALDEDLRIISYLANTGVQVAVVLDGDLVDNFIIGRLARLRLNVSPFLAIEEWGLVDYALERLAPYLIGSVAGNHDNWSFAVSGIDVLRQRHQSLTPGILYDPNELSFVLQVGECEVGVTARHDWRGHSMFNPSHGIEHKHHTRGRQFDIAIGAHKHRGGLAREIDNGAQVGHALVCGSYKKEDEHALKVGFPPPLPTAAVCSVVDEDGLVFCTSNLYSLTKLLS